MGGKRAQRTKGNTRPSSSGRSAERLAATGTSLTGFLGFGATQGDLSYIPASQGNEEIDTTVDPDFRLVMRKMAKRDVITKLKAVQEFETLCKERDIEVLKGVLPFWPRIFNKLSMDHDRRIRESVLLAHQELVVRLHKNIAPHLRTIMGNWLLAQCDPVAPVATAATKAFNSAFVPSKQSQAIAFCGNEIIALIQDNLFNQTQQTMSDPETTPAEEMEAKYIRVISSSLLAWKLLLKLLPETHWKKLEDQFKSVLAEKKFWKFAKHESSMIRSSWYSTVAYLCQSARSLIKHHSQQLCPIVIEHLDENNPSVSVVVWEAFMHIISAFPNFWDHINMQKAFLPKLWAVLDNGAQGNAVIVYPNLLLVLSKLPSNFLEEKEDFYILFFQHLKKGMLSTKVLESIQESKAVFSSFIECLQYVLSQHATGCIETDKICQHLVKELLIPLIEMSLLDSCNLKIRGYFYSLISNLVRSWHKNSSVKHKVAPFLHYQKLFWLDFTSLCITVLKCKDENLSQKLHYLSELFISFYSVKSSSSKQVKQKVKFEEPASSVGSLNRDDSPPSDLIDDTPKISDSDHESSDKQTIDLYINDNENILYDNIFVILQTAFSVIKSDMSVPHLKFSSLLFRYFVQPSLLIRLNQENAKDVTEPEIAANCFYRDQVLTWLQHIQKLDSLNEDMSSSLVELFFGLYGFMKETTRIEALKSLSASTDPYILQYMLQKFAPLQKNDTVIAKWLSSPDLGDVLVELTKRLCSLTLDMNEVNQNTDQETKAIWKLLTLCLSMNDNFEALITSDCLGKILDTFTHVLPKAQQSVSQTQIKVEQATQFVCELAERLFFNVKGCWNIPGAKELLLNLILINCQNVHVLTSNTTKKVELTWKIGIKALMEADGPSSIKFLKLVASKIRDIIIKENVDQCILKNIVETVANLIFHIYDCNKFARNTKCLFLHPDVKIFLDNILPSAETWKILQKQVSKQSLLESFLTGKLTYLKLPEYPLLPWKPTQMERFVLVSAFYSDLFIQIASYSVESSVENEELCSSNLAETLLLYETVTDFIIHFKYIFCAYGLCCQHINQEQRRSKTELQQNWRNLKDALKSNITSIFEKLSPSMRSDMVIEFIITSLNDDELWASCVSQLTDFVDKNLVTEQLKTLLDLPPKPFALQGLEIYLALADETNASNLLKFSLLPVLLQLEENWNVEEAVRITASIAHAIPKLNPEDDDAIAAIIQIFSLITEWRKKHDELFLYECDVSNSDWLYICFNVEVIKIILATLNKFSHILTADYWDFILCSVTSWIESYNDSQDSLWTSLGTLMMACFSCRLLSSISDLLSSLPYSSKKHLYPENLISDWKNFFSGSIYSVIFPLIVVNAEKLQSNFLTYPQIYASTLMVQTLKNIRLEFIENHKLPPKFNSNFDENDLILPDNIKILLNHLCPLLVSPLRPIQICVYHILLQVIPIVSKYDERRERPDDKEENMRPLIGAIQEVLDQTNSIVNLMLSDVRIGDTCIVQADTDSCSYTLGYLLTWSLVMELFSIASSELRSEYANYLQNTGIMQDLLNNLFRLMPENANLPPDYCSSLVTASKSSVRTMFTELPKLDVAARDNDVELQHQACQVYFKALKKLPALVRQWWTNQDKRVSALVDKFTAKFVSVLLSGVELQSVQQADKAFHNMTIKARPLAREVVAVYTIDEASMELVIQLPTNHPLGSVAVDCGHRMGVGNTQWRKWMLQLVTFLTHQNGSILDGLMLWKRNLDKRFEGVEECYICFYVLHGSNCQLPSLSCRTCKKKFHSACLYKWFNTSHNSSCPLCRNLF